jgi:hypothetical protein
MKMNNRSIKIDMNESLLLTPRQPEGVCRKGTFY